ncbi:DUF3343 domain-containing protein [Blautia sp. RD014234]|nr:DUF3343 domain-containing protein [Blautia parvula]
MRERTLKLVVTFGTTTRAMAMEKMCREQGLPGRPIPLPRAVSAGCGLSWCTEVQERERTEKMMQEQGLLYEGVYEVLV